MPDENLSDIPPVRIRVDGQGDWLHVGDLADAIKTNELMAEFALMTRIKNEEGATYANSLRAGLSHAILLSVGRAKSLLAQVVQQEQPPRVDPPKQINAVMPRGDDLGVGVFRLDGSEKYSVALGPSDRPWIIDAEKAREVALGLFDAAKEADRRNAS